MRSYIQLVGIVYELFLVASDLLLVVRAGSLGFSPGAPLPGSSGRGFLSSMAMKYPKSEGLVCSLYLAEILDEGAAIKSILLPLRGWYA
jgi:hypothetical protein